MSDEERVISWLEDNYKGLIIGLLIGLSALFGYKSFIANQNDYQLEISREYEISVDSYNKGNSDAILEFSNTYMSSDPSNTYTLFANLYSAKIMFEKKSYEEAISYLTHIIEHSKDIELKNLAIYRKSKILIELNDVVQALSIIDKDTENYQLIELRSDIYVLQKKYSLAAQGYREVLSFPITPNERKNITAKLNSIQ